MKKTISFFMLSAVVALAAFYAKAQTNLPILKVMGQDFYCYTVTDNNQTVYAICKDNGWELDTLAKYNSGEIGNLRKDMRLFYPVAVNVQETAVASSEPKQPEVVKHLVKKGETVYSVSRMYGITPDDIYAYNPSTRRGLKMGETLTIPCNNDVMLYTVKRGDTLYAIARNHDTTVEDILRANPGISPDHIRYDSIIRIPKGSATKNGKAVTVDKQRLESLSAYKANGKDTWSSIAENNGVEIETLMEANQGVELKKNAVVSIPHTEEYQVTEIQVVEDPREQTSEGRNEIYREVSELPAASSDFVNVVEDKGVSIAVILENPAEKMSQEFIMGFLQRIDEVKNGETKIDLRIIDAAELKDLDTDPRLNNVELIIGVYEKDFPGKLVSFGNRHHIEVVNVFDVKCEYYLDNPAVANLLAPSDYFNDSIIEKAGELFSGRNLIVVGSAESEDLLSAAVIEAISSKPVRMGVEEFTEYTFPAGKDYVVYCLPTDKASVLKVVNAVAEARNKAAGSSIIELLGRPNHVVFAENYADKLGEAGAYIPSRVFLNPSDFSVKAFNDRFKSLYDREPARTFPNYAAMGYDVATWAIPTVAYNEGDFNVDYPGYIDSLQLSIKLKRLSNWSGFINPVAYMLRFTPSYIEKNRIE